MRSKGWNQVTLAQKMGKDESQISRWLSGRHNISSDILFEFEEVLGIELINKKIEEMQLMEIYRRTSEISRILESGFTGASAITAFINDRNINTYCHVAPSGVVTVIKEREQRKFLNTQLA